MTALLIFLGFVACVALTDFIDTKMKATQKQNQAKTNVKLQDELEMKFWSQILSDLKRMDETNHLYGDELMEAFKILYHEYNVVFPDIESQYHYRSKAEKKRAVYQSQKQRYESACCIYNSQIKTATKYFSDADYRLSSFYRQIWLDFSPLRADIPPIVNNPKLLYCSPYKFNYVGKNTASFKYFDNFGNEVPLPSKEEKSSLFCYGYHPISYRLYGASNDVGFVPVPVRLIDNLVVELTKEGLKRHGFQYSPDRKDSELTTEQEKLKAEREKYPWLEEEDKKFK